MGNWSSSGSIKIDAYSVCELKHPNSCDFCKVKRKRLFQVRALPLNTKDSFCEECLEYQLEERSVKGFQIDLITPGDTQVFFSGYDERDKWGFRRRKKVNSVPTAEVIT